MFGRSHIPAVVLLIGSLPIVGVGATYASALGGDNGKRAFTRFIPSSGVLALYGERVKSGWASRGVCVAARARGDRPRRLVSWQSRGRTRKQPAMRDRSVDCTSTIQTRWQRWANRLARYGWLVLLVAAMVAIVGGTVYAATWEPRQVALPGRDACPDPPCFDGGDLQPGLRDLPAVIPVLGYLLAIALGLPSLLASLWDVLRGRHRDRHRDRPAFVQPLLFRPGACW